MFWAWMCAAWAAPQVLLVTTPGVKLDAYLPLIEAMRAKEVRVEAVVFPCSGTGDDYRRKIVSQAEGQGWTVLAHGLGATLALQSGVQAERFVLLGPVLDVVPGPAMQPLIHTSITGVLSLDTPPSEPSLRQLLLGDWEGQLTCVSPLWAKEVQQWLRDAHVPLKLAAIDAPVWLGVGLLDEVATVEAIVPASRIFPHRTLIRLGVARMDPKDYRHFDLLSDAIPVRAAVHAVLDGE